VDVEVRTEDELAILDVRVLRSPVADDFARTGEDDGVGTSEREVATCETT
jgi:hypothetical protein